MTDKVIAVKFDRDAPCPICAMTEGCAHTALERHVAQAYADGELSGARKMQDAAEMYADWTSEDGRELGISLRELRALSPEAVVKGGSHD